MMDFAEPDAEMTDASTQDKLKEVEVKPTEKVAAVPEEPGSVITIFDVFDLPKDLDITKKWLGDIRLNVIHVVGVQEMSTEEVKAYFEGEGFKTVGLEWINDKSCNVLFGDFTAAAKALTSMTSHLLVGDDEAAERLANNSIVPCKKISELEDIRVPPDSKWVLGKPCEKSSKLLFRLATSSDKKIFGQGKYSEYYRKYGNPRFGGKKHIVSSSLADKLKKMSEEGGGEIDMDDQPVKISVKDRIQVTVDKEDDDEQEPIPLRRPLGLRMRMRADDEVKKSEGSPNKKKSIWQRLDKDSKPSIQDRLGKKSLGISKNKPSSSSISVWSRLSLEDDSKSKDSSSSRAVLYSNIRRNK